MMHYTISKIKVTALEVDNVWIKKNTGCKFNELVMWVHSTHQDTSIHYCICMYLVTDLECYQFQ